MIDGSQRVAFDNVEVVRRGDLVVMCRVGIRVVGVPPRRMLPGTTIWQPGDDGCLVLPRQVALKLGLASRANRLKGRPAGSALTTQN